MINFRITGRNRYPGYNEYWVEGYYEAKVRISILYTIPAKDGALIVLTIDHYADAASTTYTTYHLVNPSHAQLRKAVRMAIDHHYEMNQALKEAQ